MPLKTIEMKILHTSDWHIGQVLNFHYDRQEEHQYFLDQLCKIIERERPDALIVSGDLYDKNTPSNTAMRFLNDNLLKICDIAPEMPLILTAGNHDSSSRIESMSGVWKRVNTHFIGAAERINDQYLTDKHILEIPGKGWIAAIPYIPDYQNDLYNLVLQEIQEKNTQNLPVILMGHTTIGNAIFSAHESTTFNGRDIVGGINSMSCGSPVQLNFKEQFAHSVTIVTIENHGDMPTIETLELEPLRKFYSIPSKPTPLEDALTYLENNLPDSQGYVQLNILSAERLPSDTENRIRNILAKGENLLYCDYKCTRPAIEGSNTIEKPDFNLSEFKEKSPLEIAERYFRDSNGTEMDDTLKELLNSVIDEVTEEQAK